MARAADLGGEINHPEIREVGLRQGDVIQSFNGQAVTSDEHLRTLAAAAPPGSTASIGVVRDGRARTVPVEIIDAAAAEKRVARTSDAASLGVRVIEPLTQELAAQFGLKPGAEGLMVAQVYDRAPGPSETGTARAIGLFVTGVTWVWPTPRRCTSSASACCSRSSLIVESAHARR